MAMLKYGTASVVEPIITVDKWVDDVYSAHCADGHCRMKTARTVLAKYDPDKYLLSHATIIAAVDVDTASSSQSDFKDYLIKPEYSKFVNNNGDAWTKQMLQSCYKTFIGANNFVEHVQIESLSKGKVVDAALREIPVGRDKNGKDLSTYYVDILVATDRKHKDLIANIESGVTSKLSMGCFLSGTEITMSDGTKQHIETLNPGDLVITHKGRVRPILNVQKKWYTGNILEIEYEGDYKTTYVTPEHPFWAFAKERYCACGCGERIKAEISGSSEHFNGKDFVFSKYKKGHYARIVNPNAKTYSLDEYRKLKEDNSILGKLSLDWIKAGGLKAGDLVSYPISNESVESPDATVEKARLIGYFLAEGSFVKDVIIEGEENDYAVRCRICGKMYNLLCTHVPIHGLTIEEYKRQHPGAPTKAKINKRLIRESRHANVDHIGLSKSRKKIGAEFSLGKHEYDTINKEICDLAAKVFPTATILRYEKSVKIIGADVAEFFEKYCGEYFDGKLLPEETLFWNQNIQKHLIAAWVLGDFNSTGSKKLQDQLHFILNRCRISHTLLKREKEKYSCDITRMTADGQSITKTYNGIRSEAYVIQMNVSGTVSIKDELNYSFPYTNKLLRLSENAPKTHDWRHDWHNRNTSDWVMRPITNIKEIPYEGWVYNFEVDEDNSYIANDIAVHNCVVGFTICSKCGRKAVDESQACQHVRYEKNNMFYDESGVQRKVAELCGHPSDPSSVKFVDASWVANPAFTGAVLRSLIAPSEEIMAKIESAEKVKGYEKKEGDFLKVAQDPKTKPAEEPTPEEKPEEAPAEEPSPDETPAEEPAPEETPAGEPAPGEEPPAGEPPAEEPMPAEEEDPKQVVKKWKKDVKKKVLQELSDEITKDLTEEEERPLEPETLDESLIKPASAILKSIHTAKKSFDDLIRRKISGLSEKNFNKLRHGAYILMTSNDLSALSNYGYNRRDFMAVLSFIDSIMPNPVPVDIKKAVIGMGGLKGREPVEALMDLVEAVNRKITKKEAQKAVAWLRLLDRYGS